MKSVKFVGNSPVPTNVTHHPPHQLSTVSLFKATDDVGHENTRMQDSSPGKERKSKTNAAQRMNDGLAHMPLRNEELLKSFIIISIIQAAFCSRRNIKCTEWEHQCHAECDLILEYLFLFQTHTMNANTFGMSLNM